LLTIDTIISLSVDIETEISEAEAYLRALDVESRSAIGDKRAMAAKLADFKKEIRSLNDDYRNCKFEAEQQALKSGSTARTKLTSNNDKLDKSTRTLEQSRMLVAQTQDVGNVILTDLESQREQLEDAHGKVKDTKQYTLDAKGMLRMMHNRAVLHKILVYVTIVVLFGIIVVMIYFGFIKKNNN
jgi:vesicle transport through interaction with t-SNAREs 1